MAIPRQSGRVVVSILLEGPEAPAPRLAELVGWTIQQVNAAGLVASWGINSWANAAIKPLMQSALGQELGLVLSPQAAKRPQGRTQLAQWLTQQKQHAGQMGCELSVFHWQGAGLPEHLDLLQEQGLVGMVGKRQVPHPPVVWQRLRLLRHGILELPPSLTLATPPGWLAALRQTGRIRSLINQAAETDGIAHFSVNLPALATNPAYALRTLRELFSLIAQSKGNGISRVETVGDCVRAVRPDRRQTPARSILRADAA